MIDTQTHDKLMAMKLTAMAEAFLELQKEAPSHERSFAEKLRYMVDREWTARENRRLSRLLRAAKLTSDASLEDVWTTPAAASPRPRSASWRRASGSSITTT